MMVLFAAMHESASGTSRHFAALRKLSLSEHGGLWQTVRPAYYGFMA
jgi:hypothetical protein